MKAILRIGFLTVVALFMVVPSAHAIQLTYNLDEQGGDGMFSGILTSDGSTRIDQDETIETSQGTYQFTGSILPNRTGLIGVSSGFRAAVGRAVPGFTPETSSGVNNGSSGEAPDSDTGDFGPFEEPFTDWTRVTIDTSATGTFEVEAVIDGLSVDEVNNVGFVRFDWVVSGISELFLDATGFGNVTIEEAVSAATLRSSATEIFPDGFIHDPTPESSSFLNDVLSDNLEVDSFLVPVDLNQVDDLGNLVFDVDFELAVSTRLNITNDLVDGVRLGNFEALFNADFSNTATLTNVVVLEDDGLTPIGNASVVDRVSGGSLVASSVPEPTSLVVLMLVGYAGGIRRRRVA